MFIRPLQVFLQAAAEDELDVLQRFVAEQPIQFRTLKHIPGIFILYGDAVDGDNCAVVIFDFDTGGVDVVLTADSFHRILLYSRLNHLVVPQGFFDGRLFDWRALRDNGIGVLRVVVTLPDGEAAFALDLRDIETGDQEAEVRKDKVFELFIGCRGLRGSQRKVLVGQLHHDLIVRPALAQKNDI